MKTAHKITLSKSDFQMEEIPDDCPDYSYLTQEEWKDRLQEFTRGDFYFIGVRASVEFQIPSKQGGYWINQTIHSPGIWGIESDSGKDYLREVFQEECAILQEMLEQLNIEVEN